MFACESWWVWERIENGGWGMGDEGVTVFGTLGMSWGWGDEEG